VAVSSIVVVPKSSLPGVPVKVPLLGSKVSQLGRLLPLDKLAEKVKVSPALGS